MNHIQLSNVFYNGFRHQSQNDTKDFLPITYCIHVFLLVYVKVV